MLAWVAVWAVTCKPTKNILIPYKKEQEIFPVPFFVHSAFLHKGKAVVLAGFVWSVFSDCAILYHSEILI